LPVPRGLFILFRVVGTESPDDELRAKETGLNEWEQRLAAREAAADQRDQRADARERGADRRELDADAREVAANEREQQLDEDAREQGTRATDPMGRFHDTVGRTAAKTDRSNAFLGRSREAVQRGVDRLDRLKSDRDADAE
jgi:hypothetical protein